MHTKLCSISLAVRGPTTSAVVVVFYYIYKIQLLFLLAAASAVDTLLVCPNINDKTAGDVIDGPTINQ